MTSSLNGITTIRASNASQRLAVEFDVLQVDIIYLFIYVKKIRNYLMQLYLRIYIHHHGVSMWHVVLR